MYLNRAEVEPFEGGCMPQACAVTTASNANKPKGGRSKTPTQVSREAAMSIVKY